MKNNLREYYASGPMKLARDGLADDVDNEKLDFLTPNNMKKEGIMIYTSGHSP